MSTFSNLLRKLPLIEPGQMPVNQPVPMRSQLPTIQPIASTPPSESVLNNFPINTRTLPTIQPILNDNGLPPSVHEAGNIAPSTPRQSWLDRLPPIDPSERPRFGNSASETPNDFPPAPKSQLPVIQPIAELSPEQQLEAARRQREEAAAIPVVDNDHGWKKKLGAILRESLIGAGQGIRSGGGLGAALGGAGGGALGYGLNPTIDEQRTKNYQLAQQDQSIGRMEKGVEFGNAQALKQAQTNTIRNDDERADAKNKADAELRKEENTRKLDRDNYLKEKDVNDRTDKEANLLTSIYNRMGEFDPNSPDNAEFLKRAKALNISFPPKRADQDVQRTQDPKTGAWYTITTDKKTGQSKTEPIRKADGNFFVTTPKEVVQGEYGVERTKIQQAGAAQRQQTTIQSRERIATLARQLTPAQLMDKLTTYTKGKYGRTLEDAKNDFKAQGIPVDQILNNQ